MIDSTTEIKEIMTASPYSIGIQAKVSDARAVMNEHKIRHLPVIADGAIVGVVSHHNLQFALGWAHSRGKELDVEDIYTPEPYVVSPDTPVFEVARTMGRKHIGCVLIAKEDGQPVGVFTTTDACRVLADCIEPGADQWSTLSGALKSKTERRQPTRSL